MNSELTLFNLLLIVATCAISFQAFNNSSFQSDWLYFPYKIKRNKDWKRFVTSGFIHADWMHLFGNMIALYAFGSNIEMFFMALTGSSIMGGLAYTIFYVSAIAVAHLPRYKKYENNAGYAALGASGAVSAVVVASAFLYPTSGILVFPLALIGKGIPGFLFAPLYLWYSDYMSKKQYDNVGHDAHFFGAIYGLIVVVILEPSSVYNFYEEVMGFLF